MEALTAVSLAASVCAFVDLGCKIVSKTNQIYRSADGALVETTESETVAKDLQGLSEKLQASTDATNDPALVALCQQSNEVAAELLSGLEKAIVAGKVTKWRSLRKALRSVWSKERLHQIEARLSWLRDQLSLHVLFELRTSHDLLAAKQSEGFASLGAFGQSFLDRLIARHDIWDVALESHAVAIQNNHDEITSLVVTETEASRTTVVQAISSAERQNFEEHATTQQLIGQQSLTAQDMHQGVTQAVERGLEALESSVNATTAAEGHATRAEQNALREQILDLQDSLRDLKDQIRERNDELKSYLAAFKSTRDTKRKGFFMERSNAITAALMALEVMRRAILTMLTTLRTKATRLFHPETARSMFKDSDAECTELVSQPVLNQEDVHNAINDYFGYYYSFMSSGWADEVVDSRAMCDRWGMSNTWQPTDDAGLKGVHVDPAEFVLGTSATDKPLWLLAMVIAATVARVGNHTHGLDLVKAVIRILVKKCGSGHAASESSPLRAFPIADTNFWFQYARTTGMVDFMRVRMPELEFPTSTERAATSSDNPIQYVDWIDISLLLGWLLGGCGRNEKKIQHIAEANINPGDRPEILSDWFAPPPDKRPYYPPAQYRGGRVAADMAHVLAAAGLKLTVSAESAAQGSFLVAYNRDPILDGSPLKRLYYHSPALNIQSRQ